MFWKNILLICTVLVAIPVRALQPITVATGLDEVFSIRADGDYIYFGTSSPSSTSALQKVLKAGGTPLIVVPGTRTVTNYSVTWMDFIGNYIYYGYGDYTAFNIDYAPKTGAAAGTNIASFGGGVLIGVSGGYAYYGANFNDLRRVPINGNGPPVTLLSGFWVRSAAIDSTDIYFADYYTRGVYKYNLASGALTTLISSNGVEMGVQIDANNVYLLNLLQVGNIHKIAKQGGPITPLATGYTLGDVASDGLTLYYVSNGALKSVPVIGGMPSVVLATISMVNTRASMLVDGGSLYWTDGSRGVGNYVIYRLGLDIPPTADAGPGQSIHAGSTVNLSGGNSYDDNTATAALGYAWTFVTRPTGSTATLTNASTATPSFVADKAGTYRVRLIVTDGGGLQSAPAEVVISSLNQTPTANAGADQLVIVFSSVQLNGSGSTDPDHDALTYSWAMTSAPANSTAVVNGPSTATPNFQPDVPGSYTMTLNVSDAFGQGTSDTVEITATTGAAFAEQKIMCAANTVSGLGPNQVTTKGNQTAFSNFLSEAVKAIQKGHTTTAIGKLNEAIERTNGCEANPANPSADGNGPGRDWVTDCNVQPPILACLRAARDALTP